MKSKSLHQDIIIGLMIMVFCSYFFFVNSHLNSKAGMMPRLLLTIMMILGLLILVDGIKKTRSSQSFDKFLTIEILKVPMSTYLYIALYVLLFRMVGYFIATTVFLIAMIRHFKEKSWKRIILVCLLYLGIIYLVFVRQLNVSVDNLGAIGTFLEMH